MFVETSAVQGFPFLIPVNTEKNRIVWTVWFLRSVSGSVCLADKKPIHWLGFYFPFFFPVTLFIAGAF